MCFCFGKDEPYSFFQQILNAPEIPVPGTGLIPSLLVQSTLARAWQSLHLCDNKTGACRKSLKE
jgi:hypothetical protein